MNVVHQVDTLPSLGRGQSVGQVPDLPGFMSSDGIPSDTQRTSGLAAHEDARALVRLVQCSQCSRPLRTPVTLPCGNSLCRDCLPETYRRENISYPISASRQRCILCPFPGCETEHSLPDCTIDVTLTKVMESIDNEVERFRATTLGKELRVEEKLTLDESLEASEKTREPRSRVLCGGRLLATFTFAEMGELAYQAGTTYETLSETGDDYRDLDAALLSSLKETTHKELDCHVCYNIMLDPTTTPCGHTFCRNCLARVLDHSSHCPVCRRPLPIPPSLERQPSNARLVELLSSLCPELIAARAEAVSLEEGGSAGGFDVPLFICTLGFPAMPTFLHIFEPRYRLMIRRVMEGNGQFGIIMYNRTGAPQGDLGAVHFMEHGTMLQILSVQMLPDGRSLIETRGLSRFKVKEWRSHDGYIVGRVERIEDLSLAEEERLEAEETSAPTTAENDPVAQLSRMSTRELLLIGVEFVNRMRANSAPWLHQRILDAYGGPPDDPAMFPYWFASILPISDDEKYILLGTSSVRERLKITAGWIRRIEAQRW